MELGPNQKEFVETLKTSLPGNLVMKAVLLMAQEATNCKVKTNEEAIKWLEEHPEEFFNSPV